MSIKNQSPYTITTVCLDRSFVYTGTRARIFGLIDYQTRYNDDMVAPWESAAATTVAAAAPTATAKPHNDSKKPTASPRTYFLLLLLRWLRNLINVRVANAHINHRRCRFYFFFSSFFNAVSTSAFTASSASASVFTFCRLVRLDLPDRRFARRRHAIRLPGLR